MYRNILFLTFTILIVKLKANDSILNQSYYWYKSSKIYLRNFSSNKVIILKNILDSNDFKVKFPNVNFSHFEKFDISKFILPYRNKKIPPIISVKVNTSFNESLVKSSPYVDFISNYYTINEENNKKVGSSNLIYVKLREETKDILKLEEFALSKDLEIIGSIKVMPKWFILRCNKNNNYDALYYSNLITENNLFDESSPDLFLDDMSLCVNDPFFASNQWGFNNTGQYNGLKGVDIKACDAWSITTGSSDIIVAVIDRGLAINHPDLQNIYNLSFNTETASSPSTNFISNSHGMNVAGVIGAKRNNNLQVAGVAPESKLMSISSNMGYSLAATLKLATGIDFARSNGASVINCSWQSVQSPVLDNAISNAINNGRLGLGCVVVFASGNDNSSVVYPANSNPEILTVGGINQCGTRASSSNFCFYFAPWGSCFGSQLDVVAPGDLIPTLDVSPNVNPLFWYGTSSAAPHVSGIAALILSKNKYLTGKQVRNIIESTTQKIGNYTYTNTANRPNGIWNNEVGYGLINAYDALLQTPICGLTNVNNQIVNSSSTFIDCEIFSKNSTIYIGTTLFSVSKESQLFDNFEVKDNAQFEIRSW